MINNKSIYTLMVFTNGNIIVFDSQGEQVPELQDPRKWHKNASYVLSNIRELYIVDMRNQKLVCFNTLDDIVTLLNIFGSKYLPKTPWYKALLYKLLAKLKVLETKVKLTKVPNLPATTTETSGTLGKVEFSNLESGSASSVVASEPVYPVSTVNKADSMLESYTITIDTPYSHGDITTSTSYYGFMDSEITTDTKNNMTEEVTVDSGEFSARTSNAQLAKTKRNVKRSTKSRKRASKKVRTSKRR